MFTPTAADIVGRTDFNEPGRECWVEVTYEDGDEVFLVPSSRGDTHYRVRGGHAEHGASEAVVWRCDCPAGQRGRECKHMWRVIRALDADGHC